MECNHIIRNFFKQIFAIIIHVIVFFRIEHPSNYICRIKKINHDYLVVREAIRIYGEQAGRLSSEERAHLLDVFDEVTDSIPDRARADVERELAELTRARMDDHREKHEGPEDVDGDPT